MGQYAEDPNQNTSQNQKQNRTQEVIIYRSPMEKEAWDNNYRSNSRDAAFVPALVSAFMIFSFCFIFITSFGSIVCRSFIKFGSSDWWDKHERLDQILTIIGLVIGLAAGFSIFWIIMP